MIEESKWQHVDAGLSRLKVDGGYLYALKNSQGVALTYSPEIDLTRYQAHLRDAYTRGYADGQEDAKRGVINEN